MADARGWLLLSSVKYDVMRKPPVFGLENVRGLANVKNKWILKRIQRILKLAGYKCYCAVMDTKEHGIPQSRPRVYLIALLKKHLRPDRPFSFLEPVPRPRLKRFLMNAGKVEKKTKLSKSVLSNVARAILAVEQLYIYMCCGWRTCFSMFVCFCFSVFCCVLSVKFNCILASRRRKLDKEGVDMDDAEDEIVVDAAAGPKFFQVMQGVCPCITKARGGQLGHYLLQAGRHVNIYEVAGLPGWKREWVDVMLDANDSVSELGKAFRDGMSLNVLQRVLPRALYSVNLLQELRRIHGKIFHPRASFPLLSTMASCGVVGKNGLLLLAFVGHARHGPVSLPGCGGQWLS
jgi:hypothetical protein